MDGVKYGSEVPILNTRCPWQAVGVNDVQETAFYLRARLTTSGGVKEQRPV